MSTLTGHASLIGTTFGPYQVQALVGRGAMGTVYLARDITLKRQVALKVLLGHLARNPLLVRRFHREAQATAHLRHANIVRIYAAGVEAGTPYIAMEYVEGEPLDRFLRRYGRLEWPRALHIGSQVAGALAAAHTEGIVHRDVKPANIMLDLQGRVRLTDFGIAQVHADLEDVAPEESFLGTPRYMSPEQCANRNITSATDLFSLGIVLYEMIAGVQPFQGESAMALIKRITNDEPPRLNKRIAGVPDDVARLVAHLLEKRPAERPRNADDVVRRISTLQMENGGRSALPDALTAFIRDQAQPRPLPAGKVSQPVTGRDRTPVEAAPARRGHGRRLAAAAAILLVAAVVPQGWLRLEEAGVTGSPLPMLENVDTAVQDGMVRVVLPAADLDVRTMDWQGDSRHVILWVAGRAGTLMHGSEGVLRLDVASGEVESIMAPGAPARTVDASRAARMEVAGAGITRLPGSATETIMFASSTATATRYLAYSADDGRPARASTLTGARENSTPWRHAERVGAWAPDGTRMCMVEHSDSGAPRRLVEIGFPEAAGTPSRLVVHEPVAQVTAIQYAPSGRGLVYVERSDSDGSWLFQVAGEERQAPQAIARVHDGSEMSFSPDGRRIAFTRHDGLLQVFDTTSERTKDFGPGRVSRDAWHPSGAYIVAFDPDRDGGQLRLVETSAPHRTRVLSDAGFVPAGAPAVSPDGAIAVALATAARGIEIVAIPLDERALSRVVARR